MQPFWMLSLFGVVGLDDVEIAWAQIGTASMRMLWSGALAAVLGWDREHRKHRAGLRTHMLVAIGTTLFVVVPTVMGATFHEVAEMVKGIAAGIGFLGAGAIYRATITQQADAPEIVYGLTTAGSIWVTAAAGVAVGVGAGTIATVGVLLSFITLTVVKKIEKNIAHTKP